MSITFTCLSCGKAYTVPDAMGGRRARCKRCQAMTTVPTAREAAAAAAGPLRHDNSLAALEAAAAAQGEGLRQHGDPPGEPGAPGGVQASPGRQMPPWVYEWVARLDRIRPRSLWAWAVVVVVVMLLVGLLDFRAALVVLVVLGGLGALAMAVAIAWSVVVGLVLGSRVIVALLVAVPATLGFGGVVKVFRRAERSSQNLSFEVVTFTHVAIAMSIIFGLFALVAGLLSNPRAFKRPFMIGAVGALLLGVCWLPGMFHAQRAAAASGNDPTPVHAGRHLPQKRPPGHRSELEPPRPRPRAAGDQPHLERMTPPIERARLPMPPPAVYADRPGPATRKAAPASVGPAPATEEAVEVKWGGSWWPAHVVRRDREWAQIEYDSGRTREWVEPWRMRAVGSKADDIPVVHSNMTYAKPNAPARPPGPKPVK